jgi:hypothetical protein
MSLVPHAPLSPEAERFLERIKPRLQAGLAEIERVPVGVLLWGPDTSSASPLAATRVSLHTTLRGLGHLAMFSEELCDTSLPHSLRVQQLLQAENFDLVVSLPATPGAIAEAHDFASHPRVTAKMLVFVNREHVGGYGENSLRALSTVVSCQVEYYPSESETGRIEQVTLEQVQRIRELRFMYGWKAAI